jgi:DNA-binding ferritin-like protein
MEQLLLDLFAARDATHKAHLATRSFAVHVALGELYERLVELADEVAEVHQGKYGLLAPNTTPSAPKFSEHGADAAGLLQALAAWAEASRAAFNPADTHLLNMWDEVIATIYRAKYKVEQLS